MYRVAGIAKALVCVGLLGCLMALGGATLTVGPNGKYQKPCQALTAAADGDTVEIDAAGDYAGDVCVWRANNVLVRGVNGRPIIDAAGKYDSERKGIWVIKGNDNIIENIEMSGARVPDGNGAPIRFEGVNLTLRWVYFHDNQEGVLTLGKNGEILVEYSEFDRNGAGSQAHNMYLNYEKRLTVRYSYFHRALEEGNVIKSRASENYFFFNKFASEEADTSWEVDISNGGTAILVGNVIQQGPNSPNFNFIPYMLEGPRPGYNNFVLMAYNTLINEGIAGDENGPAKFIWPPAGGNYSGIIMNNIFAGPGEITTKEGAQRFRIENNLIGEDPLFVNAATGDYRIKDGSPAIGKAQPLPEEYKAYDYPAWQYQAPVCGQRRPQYERPSLGAFDPGLTDITVSNPCYVIPDDLSAKVVLTVKSTLQSGRQAARVVMDGVAPPEGAEVSIQYSHPEYVVGPARVTILGGQSSVPIEIEARVPQRPTSVTLTATYRDRAVDSFLVFPIPVVNRVILSPAVITGGNTTTANVIELGGPAVSGPATVTLTSSRPDLVTLPASVTVPANGQRAGFTITTKPVTSRTVVAITASQLGVERMVNLTLEPVSLAGLVPPGRTLGAGAKHALRLALTGPAPEGGLTVQLSTRRPDLVRAPESVKVEAGLWAVAVPIEVAAAESPSYVQIEATYEEARMTAGFMVDAFRFGDVVLTPATVVGGITTGAHRVELNSPAPIDGPVIVQLSNSNPGVAKMPAAVTIQPGLGGASFTISTIPVAEEVKALIKATANLLLIGNSEKSATLTVTP